MENIDIVKVVQVRETKLEVERTQILSAADAASAFQRYLDGADHEHFVVAALNMKHVINAIHTVSIGTLDASLVHPREVFKFAILANASDERVFVRKSLIPEGANEKVAQESI